MHAKMAQSCSVENVYQIMSHFDKPSQSAELCRLLVEVVSILVTVDGISV